MPTPGGEQETLAKASEQPEDRSGCPSAPALADDAQAEPEPAVAPQQDQPEQEGGRRRRPPGPIQLLAPEPQRVPTKRVPLELAARSLGSEEPSSAPTLLERARPVLIGAAVVVGSPLLAIAARALSWCARLGRVARTQAIVDELRAVRHAA